MKPIGGYFELELNCGKEYHSKAIKLNLCRNAFEYILRAKKIEKLFVPFYTCDVMLEPISKTNTSFEFYQIDENFEPIFDFKNLNESDYFFYTNYFGLKNKYIHELSKNIKRLIIDNSQSFYSKHIDGNDTIYSPRKFFGVPDGAYVYTDVIYKNELELDNSTERFKHLIGRIENGAEEAFDQFKSNDLSFVNQPIKYMSLITKRLLENIDYSKKAKIRKKNFSYLHTKLKALNQLRFDLSEDSVPMVYPFLTKRMDLKQKLIDNKVFVATYWPNVLEWCDVNSLEYKFAKQIIHLPIDQRYSENELEFIVNLIKS